MLRHLQRLHELPIGRSDRSEGIADDRCRCEYFVIAGWDADLHEDWSQTIGAWQPLPLTTSGGTFAKSRSCIKRVGDSTYERPPGCPSCMSCQSRWA